MSINQRSNLYIGLMSGTSMDAVDTALVRFNKSGFELIAYEQFPIEQDLKNSIRKLEPNSSLEEITKFDSIMGELFAKSVNKILDITQTQKSDIAAIGNHGQTVLHLPDSDYPRTTQIGDPNLIVFETGITTVADFRRMDMAAGGQGAPLAPAFHEFAFRSEGTERVILNIGGIANITVLPSDPKKTIYGFDTGPGNGLLDDWNQLHKHTEMDIDSKWATSGTANKALLKLFMNDPYIQSAPPKSSGRDYFNLGWINHMLEGIDENISAADIQATLLELTVANICTAVETYASHTEELYACGGGARNSRLMEKISERLPNIKVATTASLGLNPDAVEAVTFAWLAKQRMQGIYGNNPSVTGASSPQILGGLYSCQS